MDELYKLEKDKVIATEAHCQSWQDIASDLQGQLTRWEEVRMTMERTEKSLEAEVSQLEQQFNSLEAENIKLRDLLYDHHIDIPDDDDDSLKDKKVREYDSDPEEAMPRTTVKTQGLLKGTMSDFVVPKEDEREDEMQALLINESLPGAKDDPDSD